MNRAIILLLVALLCGCNQADRSMQNTSAVSYEENAADNAMSDEYDANFAANDSDVADAANAVDNAMADVNAVEPATADMVAPSNEVATADMVAPSNALATADMVAPSAEPATANPPDVADGPPLPAEPGVEKGVAAFGEPPDMLIDRWYTIEFVAGPSETIIKEETEGRPLTPVRSIYVAPLMRVTLLPNKNFEIAQLGDAEKPTGADKTAIWHWNVKPVRDGSHALYAKIEVRKRHPDGSIETLEEYNRQVGVKVRTGTWKGFLLALQNATSASDAFGTLFRSLEKTLLALAALIVAIGLVAWRLGLRRKKPEEEPPAPDQ